MRLSNYTSLLPNPSIQVDNLSTGLSVYTDIVYSDILVTVTFWIQRYSDSMLVTVTLLENPPNIDLVIKSICIKAILVTVILVLVPNGAAVSGHP